MGRETTTDLAMLERLLEPADKDIVDVGCGDGALVRELAARGARLVGVEISTSQLASALAAATAGVARYLVGRAQDLPLDEASMDVVMFMRAFHHVPVADMGIALREAARILRPSGVVYVAEPLAHGDYFALTSLVEDEVAVRAAAQSALSQASRAGLCRAITVEYDIRLAVADLDALRARIVSVDPARAAIFDARRDALAESFARLGEPGQRPGERVFVQPMRADLLRPLPAEAER